MASVTRSVGPLAAWTLLVWSSRIRNVWTDDGLSTNGQVVRTFIAVVFLVFGVFLARMAWRSRDGSALSTSDSRLLVAAAVWTIGFWLVRGIGIIVDDHTVGFTVIHTILMIISIGLAVAALRARSGAATSISSSRLVAR